MSKRDTFERRRQDEGRCGPGWATWCGLGIVATAAAVLSFAALADLAVMCGIPPVLSPLLPVALDAGAGVSASVWLSRRANPAATRYAARVTWGLLVTTIGGNALHAGLVAADLRPAWWVAVAVGAVAPVTLGATIHLAVLAGRREHTVRPESAVAAVTGPTEGAGTSRTPAVVVGENPTTAGQNPVTTASQGWEPAPTPADEGSELVRTLSGDSAEKGTQIVSTPTQVDLLGSQEITADDRAAALIAEGAGRRRLARELGVTEHQARELLAERRNGHEVSR